MAGTQGARSEGMVPPLSPQIRNLREHCMIGYLCGPPMMSKTVLDLLHSLGVEEDMIMFDDIGG